MMMDIAESKKAEQISGSEARYRNPFDCARVSMWEQDFSDVAILLDQIRAEGVADLRSYFETHPAKLAETICRVRIKDVNAFTLELFEAENKDTLFGSLADTVLPEMAPIFVEEIMALWEGRRRFENEAIVRTLKGRPLDITFTVAFHGERFERTIISILDVSAQKAAERALPDVTLTGGVVTSFALLLHEFATNAAKYGALSTSSGRVAVECSEDEQQFILTWRERGGPTVAQGEGFGTLLARATVKDQLGGEMVRVWKPEGVTIGLSVPRERLTG